jgi:FKBP-type peptidyl-prolyl cis-trans isomerase
MKNIFLMIFAVFTATVFLGCKGGIGFLSKTETNFDKDESYALGLNVGTGLKEGMSNDAIRPDFNQFLKGMKDGVLGKTPRFPLDKARDKIDAALKSVMDEKNAITIQKGIDFLAENSKRKGVAMTPTGLQYEVISEGTGQKPTDTSTVKVHYEGRLIDGTLFDNTYEKQEPATFALNDVIPGWAEGLKLMNSGSKYKLYIPPELAYGPDGYGPIPAYATLVFTIELVEIVGRKVVVQEDDYYGYW